MSSENQRQEPLDFPHLVTQCVPLIRKLGSGHRSDRSIWRDVRPEAQSLAEAIDKGDEPTTAHTRQPEGCGPCRSAVHLGKRGALV
jgi:hypothetical protein